MLDFEGLLREVVSVENSFLSDVSRHLIDAGGKRIRPILSITSALAGGAEVTKEVLLAGIAVELVHLASLYHDDVMDNASQRRNVESVNSRWGNLVAIVAGDYLLAKAAGIAAGLGQEIAELLADTLAELCSGQILEVQTAFNLERTEEAYLGAISGKTASLMATSCRIGALAADLERDHVDAVTSIGRSLGMVFQLRDDILDLIADEQTLGKEPAQDLLEGIYTLPVIVALQEPGAEKLRTLLSYSMSPEAVQNAVGLVTASGGIRAAWKVAQDYAQESIKRSKSINSILGSELGAMARYLLDSTEPLVERYF